MGWKDWWEKQPDWFKVILSVLFLIVIAVISNYFPAIMKQLFNILGLQGFLIILILFLIIIIQTKYIVDVLGRKLDDIADILRRIAENSGINVGEEVHSPGYVYTNCRFIRISKIEVKDDAHHVYVYCIHPNKPMKIDGCPRGCVYMDTSDKPTGDRAFGGMILGGILGGIIGGFPGALIGGILGALLGSTTEETKPVYVKVRELRNKGIPYKLHVDKNRIKI